MSLGDVIDRALGGPERFVCDHCRNDRHKVCLGYYAGRSCACVGAEHPLRKPQ